jgi:hypothetical protein
MTFLDTLLGRAPAVATDPNARTLVVPAEQPFLNVAALKAAGRQKAEWVMTPSNGLGILTGCGIDGRGEVTLVKDDGTNKMMLDAQDKAVPFVVTVDLADLRRAYIDEIPACRHPDVDHEEHLRAFGFILSTEAAQ